jgi:carbamoyltransferase
MRILGLSAYYHDSAAVLLEDGRIVAAAQEERFSRQKHDPRFPRAAISSCLDVARVTLANVDYVAFYDKPFLKFERLLETYLACVPKGFKAFRASMPVWLGQKLFLRNVIARELRHFDAAFDSERLLFTEHHQSHAASAFFPSPFDEAAVLTMDGVGEWATTSVALGRGGDLWPLKELHFPHSLGLLYSAFTYHLGFRVNSGEYKVMGLAPYGEPRYVELILKYLIDLKSDGTFKLDQRYFDFCTGFMMTSGEFDELVGGPPRGPDEPLTQRHLDLASSIQAVTNDTVLRLANGVAEETQVPNLCLAGGVALNCVANGHILRKSRFKRLWIQPAAGDAGGALGAAMAAHYTHLRRSRNASGSDDMDGALLGPSFPDTEAARRLQHAGAKFKRLTASELLDRVSKDLAAGAAVGWFQGRMEFGPRALGNRSILADPRAPLAQSTLNLKIKYRESFRPFAPAVLRERVHQWFNLAEDSPYMLLVSDIVDSHRRTSTTRDAELTGLAKRSVTRSDIPAVTHVDYSARIQTVDRETNALFHSLLTVFEQQTGCPVLVNTSFNIRGEPIVCTPEDAFRCFMSCELDVLAVGNLYMTKAEQDPSLRRRVTVAADAD